MISALAIVKYPARKTFFNYLCFLNMPLSQKTKNWIKRLGWAWFLFFLLKGIVWLLAGAAIIDWIRK